MKSSIKNKILTLFTVIFLLFAINSLWAVINLRKLDSSINEIMKSNYMSITAVQDMSLTAERQDSLQLSYIFTKNENFIEEFLQNEINFYDSFETERNNITEVGEKELVEKIEKNYEAYSEKFKDFLEAETDEKMENIYFKEIFPIFEELKKDFRELIELNQNSMLVKKDKAAEISRKTVISIIFLSTAVCFIGIILSSFIFRKIFAQFKELISKMDKISEGDYSQKIYPMDDREFKNLAETFNKMSSELSSYRVMSIKKLMEEKKRAEAADKLKSEFVATVSHEFKTPLTSMRMAVEMLSDKSFNSNLTENQNECIKIIKEDNQRLNVLINDLLDLSRIESGKVIMDIKENSVSEIVESSLNGLKKMFESRNVICETEGLEKNYKVNADFNRIIWVMTNLLTNAVKYSSKERQLHIKIRVSETEDKKILFAVEDNGIGIPQEFLEKIFNKFIRVTVSEEGEVTGTGLGLSICRGIIENHGGKIWAESEFGKGSVFYFKLNEYRA